MRFETSGVICLEAFKDHPQLGRFTLRDEGKYYAFQTVCSLTKQKLVSYFLLEQKILKTKL